MSAVNVSAADFEIPLGVQSMIDNGFEPLTAFRTAKAMSIKQLAETSGVAAARIADFEVGKGGLLWQDFEALGNALAIPPELLPRI